MGVVRWSPRRSTGRGETGQAGRMMRWLVLALALALTGCAQGRPEPAATPQAVSASPAGQEMDRDGPAVSPAPGSATAGVAATPAPGARGREAAPPPPSPPTLQPTAEPAPGVSPTPAATASPTSAPTRSPTATAPAPPPSPTPTATVVRPTRTATATATATPRPATPTAIAVQHRFVISKQAKKYYYCETDPAWRGLAAANLVWYDSEEALRRDWPGKELHEPCR